MSKETYEKQYTDKAENLLYPDNIHAMIKDATENPRKCVYGTVIWIGNTNG